MCVYSEDCVPIPIVTGHPQTRGVFSVKRLVDPLAVVWHFHYAEVRIPGSWRNGRPSKGVQDVMSFTTSEFRMGVCWQYVYNICTIEYVFLARGYSMRICNKWDLVAEWCWRLRYVEADLPRATQQSWSIMEVWMGITDNWYDLKYQLLYRLYIGYISASAIYRLYIGYISAIYRLYMHWYG